MSTYPKDKVPAIATDALFLSGPDVGQPTRAVMSAGEQAQGVLAARFAAAKFNWMVGAMSDHVRNISEVPLRTWERVDFYNTVPGDTIANTDILRGIFCYAKGVEKTPRLHLFGTDTLQTSVRMYWAQGGSLTPYTGNTGTGSGQALEMAANADGSRLIAVGTGMGNKAIYSTDGQAFTIVNTHLADNYKSCCFSNGAFYALQAGSTTPKVGKSTDGGVTWVATAGQPFTFHTAGLCRAGKVGGVDAVLIYASNTTYTSIDGGASWSSAGVLTGGARDIRFSAALGLWMAITANFQVSTSPDGITWTQVRAGSIASIVTTFDGVQSLACDDGAAWVAVGYLNTGAAPGTFVSYSVDQGLTWTHKILDRGNASASVCWSPTEQCFYAVTDAASGGTPHMLWRTPSYGQGAGLVI